MQRLKALLALNRLSASEISRNRLIEARAATSVFESTNKKETCRQQLDRIDRQHEVRLHRGSSKVLSQSSSGSSEMASVDRTGKPPAYRLRLAECERDLETVLALIKELSVYIANSPESVTNTVENLVRDGLGDEKYFHCLLIERDGDGAEVEHLGYALYYFTYSTWEGRQLYLEDIYIRPAWQRCGVGSGVMRRLAQIASERDCARLMWQGLAGDENAKFYQSLGAICTSEWLNYKLDREGIKRVASQS